MSFLSGAARSQRVLRAALSVEIAVSYRRYANVLKWLTISLLAYPITAFFVPEPWGEIFRATFVPHIEFTPAAGTIGRGSCRSGGPFMRGH